MAYLEQNDPDILADLTRRKEFTIYKESIDRKEQDDIIPRFLLRDVVGKESGLQLHSYQKFVENFMNPNTSNTRLLMQWSPGMGKTIGSLSIALKFINFYNKMQNAGAESIGSVWILGFTENIFRADLIKYPEFGFITESELSTMTKLKELIHQGSGYDVEKYNELRMRINRRLTNRQGNGFFKFMGYKALLNQLFLTRDKDIQMTSLSENEIAKLIIEDKVILNRELMANMRNSLLICDEIHDVYNSAEKNNWGVALQTILNYDSSIRALFLSATPFNNSPTELIDLLNLLTPRTHFTEFKKKDYFTQDEKVIKEKIPELYSILSGRVSFITNNDPRYFPAKGYVGENIAGISYLKFVRSPLSKFHYKAYQGAIKNNTLGSDSQYLVDFVLPDPREKDPWGAAGIYKTGDVRSLYTAASLQWRGKYKLQYNPDADVLSGDILNLDNGDLKTISAKYAHLVSDIIDIVKGGKGKIFIYHNVIHMSGVLFIGEILKANGFISESSNSVDSTRCAICGKPRKEHSKDQLLVGGAGDSNSISHDYIEKNGEKYKYEIVEIKEIKCKKFSLNSPDIKVSFILDPYEIAPIPVSKDEGAMDKKDTSSKPTAHKNEFGEMLITQKDMLPLDFMLSKSRQNIEEWKAAFTKYTVRELGQYYYFAGPRSPLRKMERLDMVKVIGKMLDTIPELAKRFITYGGASDTHKYIPCRYTLVHSDEARKVIDRNIETFNSINNVWGEHIMILVGGKIMKQSINLICVQNLMIAGRPDNISSMLQINGRAIRTNSHVLLPPENRLVNLSIYTSCLPDKSLSIEEIKYKEKVESYKVIQQLELILHEVAIDKDINHSIIFQPQSALQKKQHYELDILPYEIAKKKKFNLSELNLETFNAYYGHEEVNTLRLIIKKIFIERSPVWKYADLLDTLKSTQNPTLDLSQISEDNFILALDGLLIKNNDKYVEPVVHELNDAIESAQLYKKLKNPLDKYVYMLDGQKYGIVHIGEYYMLMPIDTITGEPIIDVEMPFRTISKITETSMNVREYLTYDAKFNVSDKKKRFIAKWENIDIRNLELSVCDFGTNFHIGFAEDCIQYVFDIWTNPKQKKSPHHVFYLKMLYYYDMRKVIIWAHVLPDKLYEQYKDWATPYDEPIADKKITKAATTKASAGLLNLLKTSINHDNMEWVSTGMINDFNKKVKESLELYEGLAKKAKAKTKVPANYLPVGHLIGDVPRFYYPAERNSPKDSGEWKNNPTYLERNKEYKENSIVIGYDDKTKTGITVKFKLRSPIQNIKQFKDTRQIEKGALCVTKSKTYLRDIAKKLDIPESETAKDNVEELCAKIRTRLIYYELKARSSDSNIKYFYFLHEIKPETQLELASE
jgi:hypothetical protein